ncbi:sigma-70 family RNA polymerase sigma factor [Brevibacillus sp. B_LB10_24]|uniref:sigma-70 family RNA polymerase sigma factor n=1 Tax=Brevibacillus sp. B_LB10_24 TaxID=3380645 RepID=UPI0038BAA7E8
MWLDDVYRSHMKDIHAYLYRLTRNEKQAEDLTQETFFRAFQHLDTFQGEKVRPWLFKVAYHSFIDWYRKSNRNVPIDPVSLQTMAEQTDPFADPEQRALDQEAWQSFAEALHILPDKQRQVLLLRFRHQLSYDEIAEVLDIPLSDVKIALYRGRKRLQSIWRGKFYGK